MPDTSAPERAAKPSVGTVRAPSFAGGDGRIRAVALGALALAIVYFTLRGIVRGWLDSGDLAVGYGAGSAWLSGSNPYDVSVLQDHLAAAGGSDRLVSQLERLRNVFFPATLLVFAPITLLSWPQAQLLWLAGNVAATLGIALGLIRLLGWSWRSTKAIAFVAAVLALSPIHSTITSGQTGLAATAALVAALMLQRSGRGISAGVMYGVATALKVQIGLPFLAYLVWRRWRTAAVAGTVLVGMSLVSVIRMQVAGVPWLETWTANLALLSGAGGMNDPGPLNPDRYSLINLQYPLHALVSLPGWADVITYATIGLAAAATIWFNRGRQPRVDMLAFATVAVLMLLVTYHRYYDAVLLVFPIAWALSALGTTLWKPAVAVLVLSSDFVLPAQTALHELAQRGTIPDWLVASPLWETVLIAQHSWALVLMAIALLWAARLNRSANPDPRSTRQTDGLPGPARGPDREPTQPAPSVPIR